MNKRWLVAGLAAVLADCGGGIDIGGSDSLDTAGAYEPATLSSPTDGAKAAAALMDFISLSGGLGIRGSVSGSGSGKALAKATTSTPCDSGSRTFTPDESTPFQSDGRTRFDDCNEIETQNGQEVLRSIANGVLTTRCHDSVAHSECQDETSIAGEDNVPVSFELRTDTSDQKFRSLGAGRETSDGSRFADNVTQYDNLFNHKSATVVLDKVLLLESASSGNRTAQLGGSYGVNDTARALANCISGKLTVSTPDASLSIDNNENVIGGHLHFVSDGGSTADVTFQQNSVSASVNGGTPQVFSRSQFAAFCSIQ